MTIAYKVSEEDFLAFQLFTSSKSERIGRKKRNSWVFYTLVLAAAAIYFYKQGGYPLAVYFGVMTIAWGLFYPKYFKWRYKRHYKKHISDTYTKRFGQATTLEITKDSLYSKDSMGEGQVNLSEVEQVDETSRHFFIKLSSGMSLIIPKQELTDANAVKEKFQALELVVNDELNWEW